MITILKQMQTKLDNIVKTTLARPSLKEVGKEELMMLTQEFPYSAVLQFLYTKKLQHAQDPHFGDSVTRTALFFNNPHWLYQQLRNTTAVERVQAQDQETSLVSDLSQSGFESHQETLEYEGSPVYDLSPSEQALIDSITEAPDGSLVPDTAAQARETAENESESSPVTEWETESYDESVASEWMQLPTDQASSTPENIEQEISVSTAHDEIQTDMMDHSVVDEVDELSIPAAPEAFQETDMPADMDALTEGPENHEVSESTDTQVITSNLTASTDVSSVEEVEPAAAEWTKEVGDDAELNSSSIDEMVQPASDELMQQIDAETEEANSAIIDEASEPIRHASSLITVIASVAPLDSHAIHTIGTATSSSEHESSAAPSMAEEPDLTTIETDNVLGSQLLESAPAIELSSKEEIDNDDDASGLVDVDNMIGDVIAEDFSLDDIASLDSQVSGMEHIGFLPETLLEASDAQDIESDGEGAAVYTPVENQEGWDTEEFIPEQVNEEEDHPDDTDPDLHIDPDQEGPILNPGDLIKMAGLEQHNETELSFEPLHLTDYFASMGVSLPSDEQPDVFGRPSRSFTGWIKSMKRIHPEQNTVVTFTQTESEQIRTGAEQSNEQEEVLTETMAGIYAMQGLTHKAIDIYEKLSLLNPEKSAIFATKLSELKGKLP